MSQNILQNCFCKNNPNCFFCLGTGEITSLEKRYMISDRFNRELTKRKINIKTSLSPFLGLSERCLPDKFTYIITENRRTEKPSQFMISTSLKSKTGIVKDSIGASVSTLIYEIDYLRYKNLFKTKKFSVQILVNQTPLEFNNVNYSSKTLINLIQDITNYLFESYRILQLKKYWDNN